MKIQLSPGMSAGSLTATVFGTFAGIGGITHGVGEIVQGNVVHDELFFNSWATGPIAENLGGEPGLSIIPNVLISGIVTLIVSIAIIVWAILFVRRRNGGSILTGLSVLLLLLGGGVGPPVVGMLAGFAGRQHGSDFRWWGLRLSKRSGQLLARLWPWVFSMAVANGVLLFIGSLVIACIFNVNRPELFVNSFLLMIFLLLLTNITGLAFERKGREHALNKNSFLK